MVLSSLRCGKISPDSSDLPSLNRRFRIAKTYVSLLENVGFSMEKRIKLFGAMHYSQKVFIKEKRKRT